MRTLLLLALLAALAGGGRVVLGYPAAGSVLRPPDVSYQTLASNANSSGWVEVQHTAWGSGLLLDSTTALSTDECVAACLDIPECAWCSWCGLEVSGGEGRVPAAATPAPDHNCAQPPPLPLPSTAAERLHAPAAAHGLPRVLALQRQLHASAHCGRQRPASGTRLGCAQEAERGLGFLRYAAVPLGWKEDTVVHCRS